MTRLTPREMSLGLVAGILDAAIAIPVGIRGGGDLEAHFTAARLWVEGLPLYARPPRVGVWWPPLAVLLVVPFALAAQLSAAVAKGAWAAGSVACLGWSIARPPRDRWKPVALAAAAVAVPLPRDLEDLNPDARLHLPRVGLAVLDLACVALGVVALRRPKVSDAAFEELAIVGIVAVLVSPIAWVHYFVFALPVWIVALRLPPHGRAWSISLLLAGVATSGIATVWSLSVRNAVFELSLYTWGALLLLFVVAFAPRPRPVGGDTD